MTSFSDLFNNTDLSDVDIEDLPLGDHTATITHGKTRISNNGNFQVGFRFANEDGSIWMWQTLTEKSAKMFVTACAKLGITGQMLDADADAAVETAVGQEWEISIKKNGDYTNVYTNKRLDGGGSSSPAPVQPSADLIEVEFGEAPARPW